MPNESEPFAQLLREQRILDERRLARAREASSSLPGLIIAALDEGALEPGLIGALATLRGIPGVDLGATTIDLDVLDYIPVLVAQSDLVLPMSTEGGRLHVAVNGAQPNHDVLEELHFITGQEVSPYCALPGPLEAAIAEAYAQKERGERFWRGVRAEPEIDIAVILPQQEEIVDLTVPLDDAELELEIGAEDSAHDEEVLHSEEVRVGPPRVLAVDDDPGILRLLEATLKSGGYVVETAVDGRIAEEKLANTRYDLVVLDAMLPHVHGFELCARLKSNPRTRRMPVILVSAVYRGWRYAHDARESFGADDYLEKPFHVQDLLKRVRERIEGAAQKPAPQAERAEALHAKGLELLEAKKPADAKALFQQALEADPFSARAQFGLARAQQDEGDLFGAITAYERAIELRPNLFPALRALASLYEQKGFRKKAADALERAVQHAPDAESREQLRSRLLKML